MSNKSLVMVILCLSLAAVLISCSPKATEMPPAEEEAVVEEVAEEASEPVIVEINFLAGGGDDAQGQTFTQLTQTFNDTIGKEKGIVVSYQMVPSSWQEYSQKVVAQIAAGSPPDVINLSPLLKPDYASNNYLLDLKPLMEASNVDRNDWYPPTFDAWEDDKGHLLGFGHGIYTEAIYYNKNLFDAAGVEVPSLEWGNSWTYEEFAEAARQLTTGEGVDKQYGFFVEPQLGWMTPIFRAFCGSIGMPDGSGLNMDSEGSVAALEFVTDLMWTDGTAPTSQVTSATSAGDLFLTGKLAMFLDGSWWMPWYSEAITDFEWGVLPLPSGECGTYTGYWVDAYAIPATSAHPHEAFEFIKFLVGDDATNVYADNGMFGIPGKVSVAESRANDLFKPLAPEAAQVWLDSSNFGATPEYTLNWNEVWDTTNKIIQRIELGEITAEEAGIMMVEEAARLIEAVQQP